MRVKAQPIVPILVILISVLGCGRQPGMKVRCIDNLSQIEGAKKQWMSETQKATNDVPTWADLQPLLLHSEQLHCPNGGVYTLGRLDQRPTCSIGGEVHTLP
jgi:hypothetical protein